MESSLVEKVNSLILTYFEKLGYSESAGVLELEARRKGNIQHFHAVASFIKEIKNIDYKEPETTDLALPSSELASTTTDMTPSSSQLIDNIQIKASKQEIERRIKNFIDVKRSQVNASNKQEFISPHAEDEEISARTNIAAINRKIQMKTQVVENIDGPLARSSTSTKDSSHLTKYQDSAMTSHLESSTFNNGLEERCKNIETLLGLTAKPLEAELYRRIKVIEEKIMGIEQNFPKLAVNNFHYNPSNPAIPSITHVSMQKRKKAKNEFEQAAPNMAAGRKNARLHKTIDESMSGDNLIQLKQRLGNLKSQLEDQ